MKNTSLNVCAPVISMIGRISMPGASIGQMKYEMPWCFGASGSVRAMRMPNFAMLGQRRPDLLAVDHALVAVAHGAGAEVGQVAAGAGLAEQLAPDLLAAEQRARGSAPSAPAVPAWTSVGPGPADADRVDRAAAPRPGAARRR